ncbi:MAG: CBS domain-containing protein [Myxococcaceae bacterium]|nr:CBS domain-containing protein [Myxococcaceae bacterium]
MQTLRVRDVMSQPVETLGASESLTIPSLINRFRRIHHLPVVDARRRVVGMLTPADLLRHAAQAGARRVGDLMSAPAVTVTEFTPLETAARQMTDERVHALVVIREPGGELAGIVTSSDLLRALAGAAVSPETLADLPIDELMTPEPVALSPSATVADALRLMAETRARHLPVVDAGGELLAIVSDRDLDHPPEGAIAAVMTKDPTRLKSGTRLRDAYAAFADERLSAVPVVDDRGRLVGILSYVDVLAWHQSRSKA